jgi:hypothetical protein
MTGMLAMIADWVIAIAARPPAARMISACAVAALSTLGDAAAPAARKLAVP